MAFVLPDPVGKLKLGNFPEINDRNSSDCQWYGLCPVRCSNACSNGRSRSVRTPLVCDSRRVFGTALEHRRTTSEASTVARMSAHEPRTGNSIHRRTDQPVAACQSDPEQHGKSNGPGTWAANDGRSGTSADRSGSAETMGQGQGSTEEEITMPQLLRMPRAQDHLLRNWNKRRMMPSHSFPDSEQNEC